MKSVRATAHSNIALIKYWGKRDDASPELNLPAVGSLSMTLDALWTETWIAPGDADHFELDGVVPAPGVVAKVFAHLDRMWRRTHGAGSVRPPSRVRSINHLPTAAGLASSASGFAALTMAAAGAFGLEASREELAALARMGSGSAARSIFGGFVRLDRGRAVDGADCRTYPIAAAQSWPLSLVVAQTTRGSKPIGSTEGMEASRRTSPYYGPWVDTSPADLDAAQAAIADRDLSRLGELVEHSCFKMHACMMATRPPIVYWKPATVAVIHEVWAARTEGLLGFVTIDAGPHVKVLCAQADAPAMAERLGAVAGVEAVTTCKPGPQAAVEEAEVAA